MTVPAKLQSYMACGKVVIAAAEGETERVIHEADCGICTPTGDVETLAEGINKLLMRSSDELKQMEANSRKYCEEHFDKTMLMNEMDEVFDAIYREAF